MHWTQVMSAPELGRSWRIMGVHRFSCAEAAMKCEAIVEEHGPSSLTGGPPAKIEDPAPVEADQEHGPMLTHPNAVGVATACASG